MNKLNKSQIIAALITTLGGGFFMILCIYLKATPEVPIVVSNPIVEKSTTTNNTINNNNYWQVENEAETVPPSSTPKIKKEIKEAAKATKKQAPKATSPAKTPVDNNDQNCRQFIYTPESLGWKSIAEISVNSSPQNLLNSGSASVWACSGDVIVIKNLLGNSKTIKI